MPKGQYERTQCRNGHPYEEGVLPKRCKLCASAKYKRYNEAHPERVQKAQKTYREANKEPRKVLAAAWYARNRVKKIASVTKWVHDNKDKVNQRIRTSYQEKKNILVAEFGGKCQRCGWNEHTAGLDFDHLDPTQKKYGVLRGNRSLDAAREEAKKCRLLCANCHRIWTSDPEAFATAPVQ
jgi:hypothetical protein